MTWSPVWWPQVSLNDLKWSMSHSSEGEFGLLRVGFFLAQAQRLVEQLAVGDAGERVGQRFGARLAQRGAQLFHLEGGLGELVRER